MIIITAISENIEYICVDFSVGVWAQNAGISLGPRTKEHQTIKTLIIKV